MRRLRRTLLTTLSLFAALIPALCRAQEVHLPSVTRTRLPNGMQVILMEYHRAPTLSVNLIFPGGRALVPANKAGLAGLMTDILSKGTKTRTAEQISEQTDFLGASLSAGADADSVTVTLSALSRDADTGLDLLADIARHPTFPAEELDRERKLALADLESQRDDPGAIAGRVSQEVGFAGHPYGLRPTETSLKQISRDDLLAYYQKVIAPDHAALIAVGDFKTEEMLSRLRARFADWPQTGAAVVSIPAVSPAQRHIVLIDKPDATQTQVHWVRRAYARNSPDYEAGLLASTILGGGFTSRLTDEVRVKRSLTYGISSTFDPLRSGGLFTVSSFTKIETTRPLLDVTNEQLHKAAQEGLTEAELHKFKNYLAGQFAIEAQTPDALAGRLAEMVINGLPDDTIQSYLSRLNRVSLADVNRVARDYFDPGKLSLVLVGPAAKIKSQLTGIGDVETRSINVVGK